MSEEFELNIGELRRRKRQGWKGAGQARGGWRERRRQPRQGEGEREPSRMIEEESGGGGGPSPGDQEEVRSMPFDPWRLVDATRDRWAWIALGTLVLGLGAFAAGWAAIDYQVEVDLMRREASNAMSGAGDSFTPREFTFDTLQNVFRNPALLMEVSAEAQPPILPEELAGAVSLAPTRDPAMITMVLSRKGDTRQAAALANLFATNLVEFTREMQVQEAGEVRELLEQKLAMVEQSLSEVNEEFVEFSREADVLDLDRETASFLEQRSALDLQYETALIDSQALELQEEMLEKRLAGIKPGSDRLQAARAKLEDLLLEYTELHPLVQAQKREIAVLEEQAANGQLSASARGSEADRQLQEELSRIRTERRSLTNKVARLEQLRENVEERMGGLSAQSGRYALLKSRVQSLEELRSMLAGRVREAELFQNNALGYFRVFTPASAADIDMVPRWTKIGLLALAGAGIGFLGSLGLVLLTEITDNRVKTREDLTRVTKLPVLASLGDLKGMKPEEQVNWAFRTLTTLKGHLNGNGSVVCGFISAHEGEGKSTWINLLVSAASQRGFRVLTVDTRGTEDFDEDGQMRSDAEDAGEHNLLPASTSTALSHSLLEHPARIEEQFADPHAQPVVHIPLPGWVWNVERRQEWKAALERWKRMKNMVLLVELPAASKPESMLLAENVPQVVWLAGRGMSNSEETQNHLQTLRDAKCRLAGAVFNRERAPSFLKRQFSRWMPLLVAGLGVGLLVPMRSGAQETVPPEREVEQQGQGQEQEQGQGRESGGIGGTGSFSVTDPSQRGAWQERLTLGPGDVFNLSLYGRPEQTRTNVFVNPDGQISYLQAQDVPVAGMTVDELRERLSEELGRYYRTAQVMVQPVEYNSKKYYVLGAVNQQGVFTMDRPITVLEAVGRAKGLETGLNERNMVELADLSRSFLIREGERLGVDFERLFLEGDLSQNVPMHPGDYLYFPSSGRNEIYVVGEVIKPGVVGYVPRATVITAVTARGGFTPEAFKKKVLVVRGSLNRPETFVVNTAAILDARAQDFRLQSGDIVYVSRDPWETVEELLDEAGQAFVQAAVATWTGVNIGPFIRDPFFPEL